LFESNVSTAKEASVQFLFSSRAVASLVIMVGVTSCAGQPPARVKSTDGTVAPSQGLVLQLDEGERRVRRTSGKGPFILKVDRRNGGSPDLVMGYEDIAPGAEIQLHRHLVADEIVFVHRGTGVVTLGGREAQVSAGATIYIPRNTTIRLVNVGTEPLGIAFVFSQPGFEELMRDNSVPEGQPVTPMSPEERAQVQARHRWHTIAGPKP
jgi:quercetin dioxygenase-like cupin family protein